MARAYYGIQISDNILRTLEDYLVCKDAVLARTGWQKYRVGDLPQEKARDLDIDTSDANAPIDVYRDPKDVFAPETIASFEGKPVTDNHPPGSEFVTPENYRDYAFGHVQNVRKGKEPLDSGDWPLLGDIHITREPLISEVERGDKRELSCGYDYGIERRGDKICQVGILGNHVAVVPKGRAGAEARINDAAPETQPVEAPKTAGNPKPPERKYTVSNVFKHILGLGLKAYAQDADPEKLAEAAEEVKKAEGEKEERAEDKRHRADDRRARDESREGEEREEKEGHAEDRRRRADDGKSKDGHRSRMHAALDRMLDEREEEEEEEEEGHASDADLEELKDLLDEFFTEEEEEPEHEEGEEGEAEHAEDVEGFVENGEFHPIRGSEGYSGRKAGDPAKKRSKKKRRARDAESEFIEPIDEEEKHRAADAMGVLKALRPVVARSNDAALKRAFNTQLSHFTRVSRPAQGGYGAFSQAATTRAHDEHSDSANYDDLQEAYRKVHGKTSRELLQEVNK